MALPDIHSQAKFERAISAQSNNTLSDVNGESFDATGYRWLYYFVSLGNLATTATVRLQSSANGSSWSDVAGASHSVAATDDDSLVTLAVDMEANTGPYYRLVWTNGTAAANAFAATSLGIWSKDTTAGGAYAVTSVTATW